MTRRKTQVVISLLKHYEDKNGYMESQIFSDQSAICRSDKPHRVCQFELVVCFYES